MTSAAFDQTRDPAPAPSGRRITPVTLGLIALLIGSALVALVFAGERDGSVYFSVAVLAVALGVSTLSSHRAPHDRPELAFTGLAARIDGERRDGCLQRPLAAVVIELRGIAADTVIDGPAAWSEPVGVIARRLASADLGGPALFARLGPHSFGAVFAAATPADALAAAETLVALCRIPIETPVREIRVDAVAGVRHGEAGERIRGEEMLRAADASLHIDAASAAPVSTVSDRLKRHARRIVEVETEIRHSLDVDLLTARLAPVVDVQSDAVVGLRSSYDWSAVSTTDPEILRSIAGSLGLRRSIETQYLMRSIAAAGSLAESDGCRIYARIEADRVTDDRAVAQLGLLIRASGIEPGRLVLELDGWGADALGSGVHGALADLGVGVGVALRHHTTWETIPPHLSGRLDSVSVSAYDLVEDGMVSAPRINRLTRLVGGDLGRVTVLDVDSASAALELSSAGLTVQTGRVHGRPLPARDLDAWLSDRTAR